ncbi:hypothetical protein BST81_19525 [Leptolyngbya sp. 'hensonii']|uniref:hypothetical protein n=1 Tax=Leptolyngbya sp. 'hensonii' TaxID=1922337 RepID=UPI00094FE807|nr:hypothetical protein [Leptolyngbya sp. 'hensonii']OLP16632.1 hypothetical protein BST81_19525 [Leptolyngbya sp. 'hensonii']
MSTVFPPTEFEFTLPKGLVDPTGILHRQGKMRLATARDEILVQKYPQAQENPAYAVLVLLSNVITQLGTLSEVTPDMLENLFTLDLAYLREFYNRINHEGDVHIPVQCPQCQTAFRVELTLSGEF